MYARIGTTTQAYGTLASWLVDVLNVLTGNLDRPGGAMFPLAAAGQSNSAGEGGGGRGIKFGRYASRVRGLGESFGELPVACLAEEIETPGDGQIRALISVAGNPAVSTPNSTRMRAALSSLEFMVAVDCYVNETSSLADVILPVPTPLERSHYDLAFYQLSVRNVANFSPPSLPMREGMQEEWQTMLTAARDRHRPGRRRGRQRDRRLHRARGCPARDGHRRLPGARDGAGRRARPPR